MINSLISAVLQVILFSTIPLIVYISAFRKKCSFLEFIGLKAVNRKGVLLGIITSLVFVAGAIGLLFLNTDIREVLTGPDTISGQFRAMGFGNETLAIMLITALIKTSFSEEIFFRGFVAKRLIAWLGFNTGNLVQAGIFAVLHLILFISINSSAVFLVFIFLLSGLGAWLSAYINEKISGGSIIPGWISHGLGNAFSYSITAFLI